MTAREPDTRSNTQDKLELIANQRFPSQLELYKVVDFLNRSLKNRGLLFGLSKSEDGMNISVYEAPANEPAKRGNTRE